ncbi:MAG: hypothetical protein QM638_11485 [Nocardioides sp.]|uniref:hypothetical protein n=1 Tax=Nocardioides sp. TaxID=35761 RepID=UPI0039E3AB44
MNRSWNTENDHHDPRRTTDRSTASRQPAESVEEDKRQEMPEEMQEGTFAHGKAKAALEKARGWGVEWLRPTDLIARQSSRLAGRGLDLHTELARRTRTAARDGVRQMTRQLTERARRLPPVSAFGRRGAQSGPARSGVGMR